MSPAKAKALLRLRSGAERKVSKECRVAWVECGRTAGFGRIGVDGMVKIKGETVLASAAAVAPWVEDAERTL